MCYLGPDELHEPDFIWLLNTLSNLHSRDWVGQEQPFSIGNCVGILSDQAPRWSPLALPNITLLEAVVVLVAISCSSDLTYQQNTRINSHQCPWLLLNLRNPELICNIVEDAPANCHNPGPLCVRARTQ